VGEIRNYEGDPGQKQVPDQPRMAAGFSVRHTRKDQDNTYQARGIDQDEDRDIVPVIPEEFAQLANHHTKFSLMSLARY
jgi:hypothetical protein